MGVRLYPSTKNEASLEILAEVKPGTYKRLEALKQEIGLDKGGTFWENEERYEKFHNIVAKDRDLDDMHSFLLFGWGKFHSAGVAEDYCGSLNDRVKITILFHRNGIKANIDLCEGVYWG
jgi:hypothetical protein